MSLKVLQLGKFYPIAGGVEKVMYDLTTGLSGKGVDCDMLCALCEGKSRIISLNAHARLIGCKSWKKVAATMISPSMILTLRKICNEYDVIHVHHPDPMACLALFCSGYKGRVIVHWHSDIQKQKVLLRFYRPLQNWLIRRAERIIGTSPIYVAESPFLKDVQNKTVCLPIGIEPMCPNPERVEQIRRKYGNRKIIFSLGRLVPYKGFRYLVEAARHLDDSYMILIGGTGVLKEELQAEIDDMKLNGKVELVGRISEEELPAYYGACTLFCLSSIQKTEAFAIVQIEAMSCGKPVVATRIPHSGVAWVNEHGVSGLNVEPGDARELAEAIRTVTENEEVYRRYAGNARRRYETLFTKECMIEKCLNIYREVWMK